MQQGYLNTDLIAYKHYDEVNELPMKIDEYIKLKGLIPNDIAVISTEVEILRSIEYFFSKQEKTMATFVTTKDMEELAEYNPKSAEIINRYGGDLLQFQNKVNKTEEEEVLAQSLAKFEKRKKTFFMQNSGLMKFSTIHSFKGMESKTIFCVLNGHEEPEMVYTAITRAKVNLVIFDKRGSKYTSFFHRTYNTSNESLYL